MSENTELVTVFRSAETSAKDEAEEIQEVLAQLGIEASLVDDKAPGVIAGTVELRVAPIDQERAEAAIAALPTDGDTSAVLDPVTIFEATGVNAETELLAVEGMLETAGIPTIRVLTSSLPVLPVELQVARAQAEEALALIEKARASGPAAAEIEEQETE